MSETILFALVSGSVGGGQAVALSVARALVDRGHQVGAVAPDGGIVAEKFQALGGRWQVVGPMRSYSVRRAVQLGRIFRSWGVTCVYTHTVPVHEIVLAAAATLAGARLVVHRHSFGRLSPRLYRAAYQRYLWKLALRSASDVVCVSQHVQKQVAKVARCRTVVVPNGVPIPAPSERSEGAPPLVGFVGRLDANKRVGDFLEAAAIVRQHRPDARFVVVGSGPPGSGWERRSRELSHELDLDGLVTFLGAVPDAGPVMDSMDVFVLPSMLEGLPIALLEAMARGKAVVATNIPGCREVITDGVTGRLVEPGSPQAIAAAVIEMLDAPEASARMGSAARALVKRHYAESTMVSNLINVLLNREPGALGP